MKAILLAGLLTASPCMAQSWSQIGAGEKSDLYIDVTSIRPQGPYMKAWFHSKYKQYETDNRTGNLYKGYRSLVYADCRNKTFATKQYALYIDDVGDTAVQRYQTITDAELSFDDPIPGTLAVVMVERLCAKR